MLKFELRRSMRNKSCIYIFLMICLSYLLGYVLLVGVDQVKNVTLKQFYISVLTVFTQFGFMFFSFVTAYCFSRDYQMKNILLYKYKGINGLEYFITKIIVMLGESFIALLLCNIIAALFFHFSLFIFLFSTFLFLVIIFQYFVIVGAFSLLISNMIIAVGISLFYWIFTVSMLAVDKSFNYLAIYDASGTLYKVINKCYYYGRIISTSSFRIVPIYTIVLIIIACSIISLTNKRWLKNGL